MAKYANVPSIFPRLSLRGRVLEKEREVMLRNIQKNHSEQLNIERFGNEDLVPED
ncbi:hypothetical protein RUM44_002115 [Polyplax serrata]|uniref:Uncharacterized protein n=1 Tax=Polyplax serrata TaxID=468196 RepID=A0ABR1ALZ4_POLSC